MLWRSTETIVATQELELTDLQVYRNPFPDAVCQALHRYILSQPERKMVHRLTDPQYLVPTEVSDALIYPPFLLRANTAITKRYEGDSGAYRLHRDPAHFADNPLVLCTLGGQAMLSVVFDDRRLVEIDCVPNTVVVAHNNPMHIVTPPLSDEIRTFMFGGIDATQPDALEPWQEFMRMHLQDQ